MARSAADQIKINNQRMAEAVLRASVRTLTRAAGMAQDQLIAAEKAKFKSPVPFTTDTHGYRLVPATTTKPVSQFIILPKQDAYLRFTFMPESTRLPGDAGTSESYVWKPTRAGERTPSKSLPRGYTKSLIALMKDRKRSLTGGGVFLGTMHGGVSGSEGIWRRPQLTAARYITGLDGKQHLLRPRDGRKVRSIGSPQLLAKADDESQHSQQIDYAAIMKSAMKQATSQLSRRIKEELAGHGGNA